MKTGCYVGAAPTLEIVLLAAAAVLCVAGVVALAQAVITMRSVKRLADDTQSRLIPFLEKIDVTVDAVNAELLRIDGIVTQIEEVSDRVTTTTTAVQDAVHAPLEVVSNLGSTIRSAWKRTRHANR